MMLTRKDLLWVVQVTVLTTRSWPLAEYRWLILFATLIRTVPSIVNNCKRVPRL